MSWPRSTASSRAATSTPATTCKSGQSLMAVRSLTEIWIDANFKETQLARPADRPARADRRSICTAAAPRIRRPDHRLHHGHGLDAGPVAAAKRDGQLRQSGAAAAGAHRAGELRPRQGPAVRRPVGRPRMFTSRKSRPGRTPEKCCSRCSGFQRRRPTIMAKLKRIVPVFNPKRNRRPEFEAPSP